MGKEKLVLPVLAAGLLLIFFSWYNSYPIAVDSPFDFLPNHIHPFFWLGVSIVCATLYIMAMLSKRKSLKVIATLGIILFIYSTVYFFWYIPGPDSHYFRGLTEYFVETGDLDFLKSYHSYYQWPVFFVLSKIANVMGMNLRCFEFILFGLFGSLYGITLYSLFHKSSKEGAFLAVLSYFILIWWYINYQVVPFALGFGFLLILFMLDSHGEKKPATMFTMVIIYIVMTLTHSFVPLIFIIYTLIKYILTRNRQNLNFVLLTLLIYFVVLTFQSVIFFRMGIEELLGLGSYTAVTFGQNITVMAATSLDEFLQTISRIVFLITGLVAGTGFIFLFLKRKLGKTNFALLFSGAVLLIGAFTLPILGTRALQIIVIPLSLGVAYFQKTKFKRHFQCLFLILIILFVCTPIHSSYNSTSKQIMYQTEADHQFANFVVDYYYPNEKSLLGTDVRTGWYLAPKLRSPNVTLGDSLYSFFIHDPNDYNCILYTIGLEKVFLQHNYTIEGAVQEMTGYNVVYDSGDAKMLICKE